MTRDNTNLVFLDLETTGLDPQNDVILEIAALPVDKDLNILDEGWSTVIRPILPDMVGAIAYDGLSTPSWTLRQLRQSMAEVVVEMHTENGLFAAIQDNQGVTLQSAAVQFVRYAEQFVEHGVTPLAGSSVHFDRRFLARYMPVVDRFFHYRIADVSSLKEFWKRFWPEAGEPPKTKAHRALDDCRASVEELRWYRNRLSLDPKEEFVPTHHTIAASIRGH